jgi:GTPase
MNNRYPKVVIVGRTNVGKSTLFNRLIKGKKSIVSPEEGVTRDYLHDLVTYDNKTFDLLDTGGLPLAKEKDLILKEVEEIVLSAIGTADLILFVCDGKNGLVEQDRYIAKLLHKSEKPIFLLINKSDNVNAFMEHEHEFLALGFKNIFPLSALHGTGIPEVLNSITEKIGSPKAEQEEASYHVTILGKPNVGKSSLLNLLLKEERAIVSEVAGTTREAISETIAFHKEMITLTDTAGVRKKSKVEDSLEQEMVKSTFDAVRKSDIILMVADATEGQIADQDLKLMFYAFDEGKTVILIFNKTDILAEEKKYSLQHDMERYDFFLSKIPILWISCKSEKNIGKVFKEILKAQARRRQTFDKVKVNNVITEALIKRPMYHKSQLLKVMNVKPIENSISGPTFMLYVNYPEWFGPTQLGFIENQLRKNFDLLGCPVKLIPQKV